MLVIPLEIFWMAQFIQSKLEQDGKIPRGLPVTASEESNQVYWLKQ